MIELDEGEVAISVPHLLIGRVVLQEARLQGPRLFLERDASGRSNWTFDDRAPAPERSRTLPAVRSFRVTDAYGEMLETGHRSFIRLDGGPYRRRRPPRRCLGRRRVARRAAEDDARVPARSTR